MIPLLLAAMMFSQGRLQPGTGIVTGSIRITGGGSAAGIRVGAVAIDDPTGSNLVSIGETDSAGRYRLSNIPEGRYYIVAGRVNNLTFFPGGTDRTNAAEIAVEPARIKSNVDFVVPADSKRPAPPSGLLAAAGNSSEYSLYRRITAEPLVENRLKLLHEFERTFPASAQLPEVYTSLMEIYIIKSNPARAAEYGEKALKRNPQNVAALVQFSRMHTMHGDLGKGIDYAEKAVAAAASMKKQSPPPGYNLASWQSWAASLDSHAKTNLVWVRDRAAWQRKVLVSGLSRRP
jgi:hypothetical protein